MSAFSCLQWGSTAMCQGEKNLRGATSVRVWVLEGVVTQNGALSLDLKDGQTQRLPYGPWLGSVLAVSWVKPELGCEFLTLHHHPLGR